MQRSRQNCSNRTFMELKSRKGGETITLKTCSNRTFMELKFTRNGNSVCQIRLF